MRTLKFRAWHKDKKEMTDNPLHVGTSTCAMGINQLLNLFESENLILMQFTGLKDSKGKEIFESDVCRWESKEGVIEDYIVVWNDKKACYELQLIGRDVGNMEIDSDLTVIGNIYENPSLLK